MEENGYGLIIEKTARELVFGYEDPLLAILNEYLPFLVPTLKHPHYSWVVLRVFIQPMTSS